jgi:serine/threonine protein kinase
MISFACPHCKETLKVKDEMAGKRGKCAFCDQVVVAPARTTQLDTGDAKTLLPEPTRRDTSKPAPAVSPELYDFLAPPQAPDELGRLGGYRVLKVLGSGGMGVVYQAEDVQLKRQVALKALLPQLAASASNRERFLREAQTAAALEHEHVVAILQIGEDRGIPFIAMQLLKGESLEDRLKVARMSVAEVLRIGIEAAGALAAAHAAGLIHRDIKPANVWLEAPRGKVKVLDFGLARSLKSDSKLTQQGAIIGTPAYMSPEQAGGKAIDPRADLFSLGCILYRMSTGRLPFRGADTIATLMAVATHHPDPPSQLNPDVPANLSRLIMRLLSKSPADRPASARDVIAGLKEIERRPEPNVIEEPEVVARPVAMPAPKLSLDAVWFWMWPWVLIGSGVLTVLSLALLVVLLFFV